MKLNRTQRIQRQIKLNLESLLNDRDARNECNIEAENKFKALENLENKTTFNEDIWNKFKDVLINVTNEVFGKKGLSRKNCDSQRKSAK